MAPPIDRETPLVLYTYGFTSSGVYHTGHGPSFHARNLHIQKECRCREGRRGADVVKSFLRERVAGRITCRQPHFRSAEYIIRARKLAPSMVGALMFVGRVRQPRTMRLMDAHNVVGDERTTSKRRAAQLS